MPINSSDIHVRGSGADNLGGTISGAEISTAIHALFDIVRGTESLSGDIEYRCVYVKNTHPTLTLYGATVYVAADSASPDTSVAIGLGTSAINGTEQTVLTESNPPSGVTFGTPLTSSSGYVIGDLAPGQHKAVWIRRTVSAGAGAFSGDGMTLAIYGDSSA